MGEKPLRGQQLREKRRRIRKRRRLLVLVVGLLLLVLFLFGVFHVGRQAVESLLTQEQTQTIVVTQGLKIRTGPGKKYEEVALLSGGSIVDTAEQQGDWIKVRNGKYDGNWIYCPYLSPIEKISLQKTVSTKDGSGLSLRSGPSMDFPELAKIPDGMVLTYLYITNYNGSNWYYTKYKGATGWLTA